MRQKIINALWQMVYHRQLAVPSRTWEVNEEIDGNDSLHLDTLYANLANRLADEGLKIVEVEND